MTKPAVILLSGGLDSATVAAMAGQQGLELFALSVDYAQRHRFELDAAARVARAVGVRRHEIVRVDLSRFGASALTDQIEVGYSEYLVYRLKPEPSLLPVLEAFEPLQKRALLHWLQYEVSVSDDVYSAAPREAISAYWHQFGP